MDLIKELNKERLEAEVTPVKVGGLVPGKGVRGDGV